VVCPGQYCAYSHLSAMLDRTRLDWCLAMFEFELYCDDSGTDGNSPIAVAAAYISSRKQWDEFVRNWDDARTQEGFDFFHMAEFVAPREHGHKPYCDWDNTKKERVYARLANIINTRVHKGFAVAVPKGPFDSAAPQDFRDRFANDHYTFAVHCIIGLVAQHRARYKVVPPIQYVFDQGSPQTQIKAVWDVIGGDPMHAVKYGLAPDGYGFQDKKIFKPLQSADILAWQMRNHMRRVMIEGKDDVRSCHPGFKMLRADRPMQIGFFSEPQMRKVFTDLEEYEQKHGKRPYPSLVIPQLV